MRALPCVRVGLLAMLLSCGGTEPQSEAGPPASLAVVSGGGQAGTVGEELSEAVVVRVTDVQGVGVPGQLVNFVVTQGGGSVFAGSALTNATGEARERWTLGPTSGEQVLEARAVDQTTGDPLVFGQITATADPGPVKFFSLTSGTRKLFLNERLDFATMVYDAVDEFGNVITNPPLTLEVPPQFTSEGTTLWSGVETKGSVNLIIGMANQPVEVTVLRPLSELVGATGGWACDGFRYSINGSMTRLQVEFLVDSVGYPALIEGFTLGEAGLWVTRYDTQKFEDGSESVTGPTLEGLVVLSQQPGLLVIRRWANTTWVSSVQDVPQTSANPLSYRGESLCDSYWSPLTSFEPLTITH